jgi:4-amino-4-deoxy-L-arabinose transferase-like glycosyltransferase
LALLLISGVTFLMGLGRPAITDSDEAYYAEAAREMVETGDYLTPRFNYANRFQKPVLYYWFVAAGYHITGATAGAARFPAAAAGMVLVIVTWWCGRRWFGAQVGVLGALIVATSAGAVMIARLSLPDLPFVTLMSLSIAAAFAGWFDTDEPQPWMVVLAGASAGAAVLSKGPVGLLVPALVIGAALTIERRWRIVRPAHLTLGVGACAAMAVPWYAAMWWEHGYAYLHGFFVGDNLERFATTRFNEPRPVWFYVPVVLAGLLPWSLFMVLWVPKVWRLARERGMPAPPQARLLIWAVLPLLLFTVSVGKQPRYILPVLPPIAIALAASIHAHLRRTPRSGRGDLLFTTTAIATGAVVTAGGLLLLALPASQMDLSPTMLVAAGAATIVCGVGVLGAALWRPEWVPRTVVAAGVVLLLAVQFGVLSAPWPATVERVAAAIRQQLSGEARWTTHDVFIRNLVFYVASRQSGPFDDAGLVAFLESPEPSLCVIDATDLPRIEQGLRKPLHRLAEWRYFNPAAVRVGSILKPVLDDELRTVVLVSNRPLGHSRPAH